MIDKTKENMEQAARLGKDIYEMTCDLIAQEAQQNEINLFTLMAALINALTVQLNNISNNFEVEPAAPFKSAIEMLIMAYMTQFEREAIGDNK